MQNCDRTLKARNILTPNPKAMALLTWFHVLFKLNTINLWMVVIHSETYRYPIIIWLVVSTPLKNMKVSWDDYSQYMENKIHVPNHQPVICSKTGGLKQLPQPPERWQWPPLHAPHWCTTCRERFASWPVPRHAECHNLWVISWL